MQMLNRVLMLLFTVTVTVGAAIPVQAQHVNAVDFFIQNGREQIADVAIDYVIKENLIEACQDNAIYSGRVEQIVITPISSFSGSSMSLMKMLCTIDGIEIPVIKLPAEALCSGLGELVAVKTGWWFRSKIIGFTCESFAG